MSNDYEETQDEGPYYDQEMADIIADAAEKEFKEICESVQNEYDAEYDYLESLAAIRYAENNYNPGQEI